MTRTIAAICTALSLLISAQSAQAAKLRAVMYVGGCCHDYKKMPADLADHISKLADIQLDILLANGIPWTCGRLDATGNGGQ